MYSSNPADLDTISFDQDCHKIYLHLPVPFPKCLYFIRRPPELFLDLDEMCPYLPFLLSSL